MQIFADAAMQPFEIFIDPKQQAQCNSEQLTHQTNKCNNQTANAVKVAGKLDSTLCQMCTAHCTDATGIHQSRTEQKACRKFLCQPFLDALASLVFKLSVSQ